MAKEGVNAEAHVLGLGWGEAAGGQPSMLAGGGVAAAPLKGIVERRCTGERAVTLSKQQSSRIAALEMVRPLSGGNELCLKGGAGAQGGALGGGALRRRRARCVAVECCSNLRAAHRIALARAGGA